MSNNKLPERKPEICSGRAEPRKRNILDVRKIFLDVRNIFLDVRKILRGRTNKFLYVRGRTQNFLDVRKISAQYVSLQNFAGRTQNLRTQICSGAYEQFCGGVRKNFCGVFATLDVRKKFPRRTQKFPQTPATDGAYAAREGTPLPLAALMCPPSDAQCTRSIGRRCNPPLQVPSPTKIQ